VREKDKSDWVKERTKDALRESEHKNIRNKAYFDEAPGDDNV
jgi:hypothetical protein